MESENEFDLYQKVVKTSQEVEEVKKLLEDNTQIAKDTYSVNAAIEDSVSTIKKIAIFFLVIAIISMVVACIMSYKAAKAQAEIRDSLKTSFYSEY